MKPQWLKEIEMLLPDILALVKKCEEPFQQKCFEILMMHALKEYETYPPQPISLIPKTPQAISKQFPGKYQAFLQQNKLSEDDLHNLIDFNSGQVLLTTVGKNKAERQRTLATLIALWHCAKEGAFKIPRDELTEQCKHFDAYDQNLAGNVKSTEDNGVKVFIPEKDGYKVSGPGEVFAAKTIRELLGSGESP